MENTKYDVFISYSRHDYVDEYENVIPNNEVSKIMKALTDAGITYWIDKEGIYSGDKFTEELPKIIKSSPIFVYLSTANSNKSKYTSKEIAIADEYGKYIIPVRIDMTPYSDKVIFRIADISFIKYCVNPNKGREDLVKSIKSYLEKEAEKKEQELEEKKLKEKALEEQRKQQEAEVKIQKQIAEVEAEISAEESRKIERRKVVLQKETELRLAQVDLEECEEKITKLRNRLQQFKQPMEEKQRIVGQECYKAEKKRKDVTEEVRRRIEEALKEEGKNSVCFTVKGVSFKMIHVEGGTFKMGATREQEHPSDDEKPVHQVTLGSYSIGEAPVTQKLWQAVMGSNPSTFKNAQHPVEGVSWNDCQEFIWKLNQKTGKNFRLPTEAEWEFAARGGMKSKGYKYSGSSKINEIAWYCGNSSYGTHPVKKKSPNELGIYDMSGNVWEWCQDCYGSYNSRSQTNPTGLASSYRRVRRGGSWYSGAIRCRLSYRGKNAPYHTDNDLGLRLVLSE